MTARAIAEVDLAAIAANVTALSAHVEPAAVCIVVKADGYGHGAIEVARTAVEAGAEMLAVAQVAEAHELRDAGIGGRILLLSEPTADEVEHAVHLDLELSAYTLDGVKAIAAAAPDSAPVPIHVKVDTGMHRVGASRTEVVDVALAVTSSPSLELAAVWTHCAVADEPDNDYTAIQLDRFEQSLADLRAAGVDAPVRHAANSAAALAHPSSRYDLVRCGIAAYGIDPAPALHGIVELRPSMRLSSSVAFVKSVDAGEGISYGLHHRFAADTVVATVPIGYADGVTRRLGLVGQPVLIGGARCPIVGVVTMDQLMVDCGSRPSVGTGDEVVLIGEQGGQRVTADEWAEALGTIAYEVVCGIGPRVARRYVR